jgi:hypothetical protein
MLDGHAGFSLVSLTMRNIPSYATSAPWFGTRACCRGGSEEEVGFGNGRCLFAWGFEETFTDYWHLPGRPLISRISSSHCTRTPLKDINPIASTIAVSLVSPTVTAVSSVNLTSARFDSACAASPIRVLFGFANQTSHLIESSVSRSEERVESLCVTSPICRTQLNKEF